MKMRRDRAVNIRWPNDADDEALDGQTIRTPLTLMDSMAGFRPGYVQVSDDYVAIRRAARDAYIRDLTSAWKDGGRVRPDDEDNLRREADRRRSADFAPRSRINDARQQEIADAARTASYLAMCDRLSNAWRTPTRDFAQPDQGSTPAELRRYQRGEAAAPVSGGNAPSPGDREKLYEARKRDLENAWRTLGVTNPNAATGIERQGEQWRGGR
jgi:hypothetical protein